MKVLISNEYGGFYLPAEVKRYVGEDRDCLIDRADKRLISFMETGNYIKYNCPEMCIVEIPDDATDYKIIEYDGLEHVIYVLNGKIYEKYGED